MRSHPDERLADRPMDEQYALTDDLPEGVPPKFAALGLTYDDVLLLSLIHI